MLEVTEFGAENSTPLRIWPINNQNVCIFLRSVCIKKKHKVRWRKKWTCRNSIWTCSMSLMIAIIILNNLKNIRKNYLCIQGNFTCFTPNRLFSIKSNFLFCNIKQLPPPGYYSFFSHLLVTHSTNFSHASNSE